MSQQTARASDDGDRDGQNAGRVPDLLEALERAAVNIGGPRSFYLADRNILIDDPKDKIFPQFGDARAKIEDGNAIQSREIYFALYQALAKDERRPGLYKEYAPDFFDLVTVDECHRGSAREGSNWREILDYFGPATKLGMTATPLRDDNRDTCEYFGNPIYTYSLRQGRISRALSCPPDHLGMGRCRLGGRAGMSSGMQ